MKVLRYLGLIVGILLMDTLIFISPVSATGAIQLGGNNSTSTTADGAISNNGYAVSYYFKTSASWNVSYFTADCRSYSTAGSRVVTLNVYNSTSSGEPVGSSLFAINTTVNFPYGSFTLNSFYTMGLTLSASSWYCVVFTDDNSSGNDYLAEGMNTSTGVDCSYGGYYYSSWHMQSIIPGSSCAGFSIWGLAMQPDTCLTLTPVDATNDAVSMSGIVTYLQAGHTPVEAYIEYGQSQTAVIVQDCGQINQSGLKGEFRFVLKNAPPFAMTYQAYVVDSGGVIYYGGWQNFTEGSGGLSNKADIENISYKYIDINSESFDCILLSMGAESTGNVYLELGTNATPVSGTGTLNTGTNGYSMGTGVTFAPAEFNTTLRGLSTNTTYYFVYEYVGGSGALYWSPTYSFMTGNPNAPGAINGIGGWLSSHGWASQGVWWIILAFLLALDFALLHKEGWQKALAVAIGALLFGAWIFFGLVDWWALILLAVAFGVVAWKFIFSGGD